MEAETPREIEKRLKFLVFVLGLMVGLGLVAIGMAIYQQSLSLVVPVGLLAVVAIPLVVAIRRLR